METSPAKSSPAVSVVMPVHNDARTLEASVESVLAQTFRDFELIICNDASTDESWKILESITDELVSVMHNGSNLGGGAARDRAIAAARGDWLAFIDADDAWSVERLQTLLVNADASHSEMIFDDLLECHDTANGLVPWRVLRGRHAFGGDGTENVNVPIEDFVSQKRLLIKPLLPLKHLKRHHICHTKRPFAEDTEFFLKSISHGLHLRYVPKAMYYYRITPASLSGATGRYQMMQEVLEKAIEQFAHAPAVQRALQKKISMIARTGDYMPFVWSLKKRQFCTAFRIARRLPWVVPEFMRRLGHNLVYHAYRIWNGGRTRGFR